MYVSLDSGHKLLSKASEFTPHRQRLRPVVPFTSDPCPSRRNLSHAYFLWESGLFSASSYFMTEVECFSSLHLIFAYNYLHIRLQF